MCKIFVINDMSKIKNVGDTINTISKHITMYERDGFGYAIQGSKGLFGEKTTNVDSFKTNFSSKLLDEPWVLMDYDRFGNISRPIGSGVFHGRTSTNVVSLRNTHPIREDNWTLIHNGVVDNEGPDLKDLKTTTDSEILLKYVKSGGIKDIEQYVSGYYAFAALDPKGNLHICRDDQATLYVTYSHSIESYIFATTIELLTNICKDLKLKIGRINKVKNDVYLEFNKNQVLNYQDIKPLGYNYYQAGYMSKSLSYLDSDTINNKSAKKERTRKHDSEADLLYNSESFQLYLDEINEIDDSYEIQDSSGQTIKLDDFKRMGMDEQLDYFVYRYDGTLVDPYDYWESAYDKKLA